MNAIEFYNITPDMIQRCFELSEENQYYDNVYNFLCDIIESDKQMEDLSLNQRNWLSEISNDLKNNWIY
jgi:hypothetical protein